MVGRYRFECGCCSRLFATLIVQVFLSLSRFIYSIDPEFLRFEFLFYYDMPM